MTMNEVGQDSWMSAAVKPARRRDLGRVRLRDSLVDVELDRILAPHGETALEPKAMAVLAYLIERAGAVVSTSELIDVVWLGRPMGDNPVYRCITQLRRALGDDPRAPTYIVTVPTKGYRLVAPVELLDSPPMELPSSAPTLPDDPQRARLGTYSPSWRWLWLGLLAIPAVLLGYRMASAPSGSPHAVATTLAVVPLRAMSGGEAGVSLAQSVTDVIRHRMERLPGMIVLASSSTADTAKATSDPRTMARRLNAHFLLRGDAAQEGGRLRVDVQLLDGQSTKVLWSSTLDRSKNDVASIRDDIARNIADVLHLPTDSTTGHSAGTGSIDLEAYQIYIRGRRLLDAGVSETRDEAIELFRRATILDSGFARAYLGLGEALVAEAEADPGPAAETRRQAAKAFDRALLLDPAMGEAWVGRGRNTFDPEQADAYFRKGLALAPSDAEGLVHYARFLYLTSRAGEAIDALERARKIDPQAPQLCLLQAFFVMVARSDVAAHDRLVRQALQINPRLPAALYQLAYSHWEYTGQFAEAARIIRQAIAVDPQYPAARMLARDIYLDLGDPDAAMTALGSSADAAATMELAQYQGDQAGAAALLKDVPSTNWTDRGSRASMAQAVRDAALKTGDFAPALLAMRAVQAEREREGNLPLTYRGFSLVYAHTLVLAGNVQAGRRLARTTLALVNAHGVGRPHDWFCRERASAFAILGDDAQVLEELAHCIENGRTYRWWYLAGHDPLYAHLRDNPRFQSLNRLAMAQRDRQRALLDEVKGASDKF